MTNEIYIENKRLDITQGEDQLLTLSVDDVKDFAYRNTTYSKTIILPGTKNNNFLFGNLLDVRSMSTYNAGADNVGYNFNPAKQAECKIFQNHLQVFKGIIRLLAININDGIAEYECAVFGELGGLINSIGNGKLEDLDFSAYDTTLTVPNVSGSWNSINGSGVYFPLIDVGSVSSGKVNYDILTFRPALYVKEYFEKIFAAAGYTYSAPLFETARFKTLIVPYNQKELIRREDLWVNAEKLDLGYYEIIANPTTDALFMWTGATFLNYTGHTTGPDYDYFTYSGTTGITGRAVLRIHGTINNSGSLLQYAIRQNGTAIASGVLDDTGGVTQDFDINEDVALTQSFGDVFDVQFTSDGGGTYTVTSDTGSFKIISDIPQITAVASTGSIYVNDCIPRNVLQKDFIGSILRLFNLYVYEDKLKSKFLNITAYPDFYSTDPTDFEDWTYKLDRGKQYSINPMSELNSRFYDFKFKQDNDYYNELYRNRYGENFGDYLFDSDFHFDSNRTAIELIFSGTPLVGYSGVDKIVSTLYKKNAGTEERMDTNIRIMQAKRITGITSWAIMDGVSTLTSGITVYGYAGNYDDPDAPANDIHFGVPKELFFTLLSGAINVTQFNVYWSPYMAEITDKDSRLLSGYFKLNAKDIYNLDFSKPVYLDGCYWRINKIEDWNASMPDLCKVSLLKIIQTQY